MSGEGSPSGASPMTAAEVVTRLASLDAQTIAALRVAFAAPNTTPGVNALLAPTLQGTLEALQIAFPSATERFLRQLLI